MNGIFLESQEIYLFEKEIDNLFDDSIAYVEYTSVITEASDSKSLFGKIIDKVISVINTIKEKISSLFKSKVDKDLEKMKKLDQSKKVKVSADYNEFISESQSMGSDLDKLMNDSNLTQEKVDAAQAKMKSLKEKVKKGAVITIGVGALAAVAFKVKGTVEKNTGKSITSLLKFKKDYGDNMPDNLDAGNVRTNAYKEFNKEYKEKLKAHRDHVNKPNKFNGTQKEYEQTRRRLFSQLVNVQQEFARYQADYISGVARDVNAAVSDYEPEPYKAPSVEERNAAAAAYSKSVAEKRAKEAEADKKKGWFK